MKRAQILIRLESDSTESHRDNVAVVKQNQESEVDCNTSNSLESAPITKSALDEAVRLLQEQLFLQDLAKEKSVCAVRGDNRGRRPYGVERRKTLICFECGVKVMG